MCMYILYVCEQVLTRSTLIRVCGTLYKYSEYDSIICICIIVRVHLRTHVDYLYTYAYEYVIVVLRIPAYFVLVCSVHSM